MKKIYLQFFVILLACVLTAGSVSALTVEGDNRSYDGRFTDIAESDWYYDAVAWACGKGLVSGKTDTTFSPDATLTRAEAVKLAALAHQILVTGAVDESAFASSGSHWYDGYVAYGLVHGIVSKDDAGWGETATRAQVAVFFSRAMIQSGVEIADINELPFGSLPDVNRELWYAGAVYRMARWGILTGNAAGELRPETGIRRSEVCTLVWRMLDAEQRVTLDENGKPIVDEKPATVPSETTAVSPAEPEKQPVTSEKEPISTAALTLYTGSRDKKSFTGITGVAAQFSISDGEAITDAAYALDLVQSLVLESDNISFRLYTGAGFEALGIVRGWLNEAARGKDGAAVRESAAVHASLNELAYLWVDGARIPLTELWYADHGDYTTYAFYFDRAVDPAAVSTVDFACGRLNEEQLTGASMGGVYEMIAEADREGVITADPTPVESDNYTAAVNDAKARAAEILFEYACERCDILYGRGLYGREADEYRLLFIFKDGTTQTVAAQKLDNLRMNANGTVLYYSMQGPDGKAIQYGINFEE